MATTGPDLSGAVQAVERLMDDTCSITDPGDMDDAVLTESGDLEPRGARTPTYVGKCKIKQAEARYSDLAGHVAVRADYEGAVPLGAPELRNGMIWKHLSSRRDPQLVDKRFKVVAVLHSSFAVQRKVLLVEIP